MSGRFSVTYQLSAAGKFAAESLANWICLEQSAELPAEAISDEHRRNFCGQIESFVQTGDTRWLAQISFPVLLAGDEISQFLNVLFGNISIGEGIRIIAIDWGKFPFFKGPRFGIDGVRSELGIFNRPLSSTALKPVGFSAGKLGKLCYQFAKGGIDIIKDDHGLANQSTATFDDRLKACQVAVKRAFEETGLRSWYFPNVTGDGSEMNRRLEAATNAGCRGVLISPHLIGLDKLAEVRNRSNLMIMVHPAFSGTLTGNETHGLSHRFLYGELWRALGSDFSIYPNTGGRFPYTPDICQSINDGCRDGALPFKKTFPTPGGGISVDRIPEWKLKYGSDTVFLIGGSLYRDEVGIESASRSFAEALKISSKEEE